MTSFRFCDATGSKNISLGSSHRSIDTAISDGSAAIVQLARNLRGSGQVVVEVCRETEEELSQYAPDVFIDWNRRVYRHRPTIYRSHWCTERFFRASAGQYLHTEVPLRFDRHGDGQRLVGEFELSEGAVGVVLALQKQGFCGDINADEGGQLRAPAPSSATRIRSSVARMLEFPKTVTVTQECRLLEILYEELQDIRACMEMDSLTFAAQAAAMRLHVQEDRPETHLQDGDWWQEHRLSKMAYDLHDAAAYRWSHSAAPYGGVHEYQGILDGFLILDAEREFLSRHRPSSLDRLKDALSST